MRDKERCMVEHNPYDASKVAATGSSTPQSPLLPVAVGLLVTTILHIVSGLFFFMYVYQVSQSPDADPQSTHSLIVSSLYYGITMLYCALLASGVVTMLRHRSYLWSLTVCILAVVPVFGPGYFLAIPFGIWGIIVLRRPDVRALFNTA
jgi:hypothetical protein